MSSYARLGIAIAAVVLAAAVGIGIYANSTGGPPPGPSASPTPSVAGSPSAAPSATPIPPMFGTWLAPEVTCDPQNAAIAAAGFTAEQIAASGWTCAAGTTNRYRLQFEGNDRLRVYDKGVLAFPGQYHVVNETTVEVLSEGGDFCLTYEYAIEGDQLTIRMTDHGCPTTGEAPLTDQVAQTAIFETSPFLRQP